MEGGARTIQAVDLWGSESAHVVYYDNLSLEPLDAPCPADLDGSGAVDFGDLLAVLSAWGNTGGPEDIDRNGTVGFGDLLLILTEWGPCPG